MTESPSTVRTDPAFGPAWSAGLRRGSEAELDAWLAFALEAADVADEMARASFRRDLEITTKPDRTHVTQVDQAIERAVRERIAAAWPDHGIVGEEEGVAAAGASLRWYLDPIDGTANFIRGIPLFGFLLAVERDGELQAGVISMPILGERWYARRGGGAWTVETRPGGSGAPRQVGVSAVAELADAQVVFGATREIGAATSLAGFGDLVAASWRDRGFGDCWSYALVAAGSAEIMLEADVHVWDVAAPAVIVEEAGGRFTDALGERTIHADTAVATNGRLHEVALRRLARTGP